MGGYHSIPKWPRHNHNRVLQGPWGWGRYGAATLSNAGATYLGVLDMVAEDRIKTYNEMKAVRLGCMPGSEGTDSIDLYGVEVPIPLSHIGQFKELYGQYSKLDLLGVGICIADKYVGIEKKVIGEGMTDAGQELKDAGDKWADAWNLLREGDYQGAWDKAASGWSDVGDIGAIAEETRKEALEQPDPYKLGAEAFQTSKEILNPFTLAGEAGVGGIAYFAFFQSALTLIFVANYIKSRFR